MAVVPDDDEDDDLGRNSEDEDPQPPRSQNPPTPQNPARKCWQAGHVRNSLCSARQVCEVSVRVSRSSI